MPTDERVIVCCIKWGTKYPPVYANRLRNMVRRHLSHPHDFVCLTDDPAGLDSGIEPVPLPTGLRGYWNKIAIFKEGIFERGSTVVYLDVDVVVVGALDFLLDDPGGLRICRNLGITAGYNSSVMRIQAGEFPLVYDRFRERLEDVVDSGRYVGDQDWIYEQAPGAKLFPDDKVVSYKKDLDSHVFPLARKLRIGWIKAPRWMTVSPPPGASIVVFHGKPDPEDVASAPYGPWKRAPFVEEHWR